jgi:hypothetical protein
MYFDNLKQFLINFRTDDASFGSNLLAQMSWSEKLLHQVKIYLQRWFYDIDFFQMFLGYVTLSKNINY